MQLCIAPKSKATANKTIPIKKKEKEGDAFTDEAQQILKEF